MLIRHAEIEGDARWDVRIADGKSVEIGQGLVPAGDESVLEAAGGALLPGLHDHHLHLFALAAAEASVRCGPPEVRDRTALRRALREHGGTGEWIRGIGYHDSVAGALDYEILDALVLERPVRIQHRSGALWMLNSRAVERLGLDRGEDADGVERDAQGCATGRLFHLDAWLRERLGSDEVPSLEPVGRRLASFGVSGVTDASHTNTDREGALLLDAVEKGQLPQRLTLMGALGLSDPRHPRVTRDALKIMLAENRLPSPEELESQFELAREQGRKLAVHCVTRAQLVLACAAFGTVGAQPSDRIEHASVTPPELMARIAELGLTVVTQPGFIRERGDAYAVEVEARDRPWLYRGRGFLEAGVPLAAATDAPFGHPDPWRAMQAAVERCSAGGVSLGPDEALTPERALALFTTPAQDPGGAPRRVAVGERADLCLLDRPWSAARENLSSEHVAATLCDGALIWRA